MCFYLRSFIWILVFIFIAYPVAFIASIFYVFIQPFALCFQFVFNIEDYLFELVSLPLSCMYNIIYSRSFSLNRKDQTRPNSHQNSHQSSLRQVNNQLQTNNFVNIIDSGLEINHNQTPTIKLEQISTSSKKNSSINLEDNYAVWSNFYRIFIFL